MSTAIPLTYVLPVLQELECFGHPRAKVFRQAGLQAPRNATATLPVLQFTRLYGCAIRLLESETSRRADHSVMSKEITDLLCHCVISCQSLAEVIDRAAGFNRILGPVGGSLELVRRSGTAELIVDSRRLRRDFAAFLVDLASMNFYRQLFSWLIGQPIRLLRAAVMYPAPASLMPITELLGVPLTYGAPDNRLVMPASYLAQPVVRSGAELARSLDYFPFPFDVWVGDAAQDRLSERIRMLLMGGLQRQERLPDSEAAARLLGISPATLRRRLQDSSTSYAKIRAGCQREWAEYLLAFTRSPVQEIAVQLGFGDDRAFRRAFRKWTGHGPVEFRRGRGVQAETSA